MSKQVYWGCIAVLILSFSSYGQEDYRHMKFVTMDGSQDYIPFGLRLHSFLAGLNEADSPLGEKDRQVIKSIKAERMEMTISMRAQTARKLDEVCPSLIENTRTEDIDVEKLAQATDRAGFDEWAQLDHYYSLKLRDLSVEGQQFIMDGALDAASTFRVTRPDYHGMSSDEIAKFREHIKESCTNFQVRQREPAVRIEEKDGIKNTIITL